MDFLCQDLKHSKEIKMKFWQLMSIMHSNEKIIDVIATNKHEWKFITDWVKQYDSLINIQDRDKLDYELPDQFTQEVLELCDLLFYLSEDGIWLRSWLTSPTDRILTARETFDRYGGKSMDEAIEYGSFKVS